MSAISLFRVGLVLAALLTLGACRDTGAEGEYFAINGRFVVFNYRVARATYLVTLKPLQPIAEGQTAVATMENPAGGEAIVVREKIWPNLDKVTIESPPLHCIVKDRPYAVSIVIEGKDGKVLQKLDTTVTSSLDQTVLPDAPLVVGPLYTPNPALAGRPGGDLPPDQVEACPPAA